MKDIKNYINERKNYSKYVDSVDKLYKIARESGDIKKYPYAIDAIAYFIFGDKSRDNIVSEINRGEWGHNEEHKLEDESEISSLMLDYETSWGEKDSIEEIDKAIRNMKLKNGDKVEDVF